MKSSGFEGLTTMAVSYAKLRLLIVDDDVHTRLVLKEVLLSLGFQRDNILEAGDGLEALDRLTIETVNFIICDYRMEPMDGLTFVRKLRDPKVNRNPFIPVIFCSAYADEELVGRARDHGVNEVLAKPLITTNIESRIRAVIERPRPFVDAAQYFGPDRRRRRDDGDYAGDRRAKKRVRIKQVEDTLPRPATKT